MKEYKDQVTTSNTGALRTNKGKPRMDLFPVRILQCLNKPLELGLLKGYPKGNWQKGFNYSTLVSCFMRHFSKFWDEGVEYDEESKDKYDFLLHHLDAALWNLAVLRLQVLDGRTELDDRSADLNKGLALYGYSYSAYDSSDGGGYNDNNPA